MAYETAFRNIGALGGGSLLGTLGQVLEPLDYPRRAAYNLISQPGEFDWQALLPGLLGLATGAGMGMAGLGLPAAMMGGSLAGGAAQGVGEMVDPQAFQAYTPGDVVEGLGGDPESLLGMAQSAGLGMATDPLLFAGMTGGARLGENLGRQADQVMAGKQALAQQLPRELKAFEDIEQQMSPALTRALANQQNAMIPVQQRGVAQMFGPGAALENTYPTTYAPEVLGELPARLPTMAKAAMDPRVYKNYDPQAAAVLENLQLGQRTPEGLMLTGPNQRVSFTTSRGPKLVLREGDVIPPSPTQFVPGMEPAMEPLQTFAQMRNMTPEQQAFHHFLSPQIGQAVQQPLDMGLAQVRQGFTEALQRYRQAAAGQTDDLSWFQRLLHRLTPDVPMQNIRNMPDVNSMDPFWNPMLGQGRLGAY